MPCPELRGNAHKLKNVKVRRSVKTSTASTREVIERQLYHFADALELNYGKVYLRQVFSDGNVEVSLKIYTARVKTLKENNYPKIAFYSNKAGRADD